MANEDPIQLGYRGIEALDVGDKVLYKVASCSEYCPAEVTKKAGTTGVMIKLERPYYTNSTTIPADQEICAGAQEVYWDRTTKIPALTLEHLLVR